MKIESMVKLMVARKAELEKLQDTLRDHIDFDIWDKYEHEIYAINDYLEDTPYK